VAEVGLTATAVKVVIVLLTVIIDGQLRTVTLLSVALTKSPIVPGMIPAVNVTEEPVLLERVPYPTLVRFHE
jgi:hypothetical protein